MLGFTPIAGAPIASAGGGTTITGYNAAQTESGTAADVESAIEGYFPTIAEVGSATDLTAALAAFLAALADSDPISDSTSALGNLTRSEVETGSAADTSSLGVVAFSVSASDTDTINDARSTTAALFAVQAETDTIADTSSNAALLTSSIAESGAALDTDLGSVASTATIAEPGAITDVSSLGTVVLLGSVAETDAVSDTQSAVSLLLATQTETAAAADLVSGSGSALVSMAETDPVYELVSSMATFSAGVTDADPITDVQAAIRSMLADEAETLAATDAPSAFQPIPPRSINELAPLTDETHTPPFVPGVAAQLEYGDGEDITSVSIMQAGQARDELLMSADSEDAVANVGYSGTTIDGYSLVDVSTGFVYLFYTAETDETGSITDAQDGSGGYTASIVELEDYFVVDVYDAALTPLSDVSDTLALTDAQTKAQNAFVARLEALSAVDATDTDVIQRQALVVETLALVDHESATFNAGGKSVHETLAAIDTEHTGKAVAVSTADILSLIDATNRTPGLLRSVHEIDTLADLIGVPSFTLHKAVIEACNAIDTSQRSFLVFRVQAEAANAVDHPSAGAAGLHYTAVEVEAARAVDAPNAIIPFVGTRTEVLKAADIEHALDVSGFIIGNPERVTIPYRRRVWVISSTRQE